MRTVEEIIDGLIAKSRNELLDSPAPKTLGDLAKENDITPTHFSRIRKGKAKLQEEQAKKIANLFYRGDEINIQRLVSELLKAVEVHALEQTEEQTGLKLSLLAADELFDSVSSLFGRLCNPDSLLIVDYRDLPQAAKGGHYHDLTDAVVNAVKEGLHFAMVQPFGTIDKLQKSLIDCIMKSDQSDDYVEAQKAFSYLYNLSTSVRTFFRNVNRQLKEMERDGEKIEGQICLYEANREAPLLISCGIQSRLFYAAYPYNHKQREEIYQWIVEQSNLHRFRHRDLTSISTEAVKLQFSPIPQFWEKNNHRLPETADELKEAWKGLIPELRNVDGERETHFEWVVINDKEGGAKSTDEVTNVARGV